MRHRLILAESLLLVAVGLSACGHAQTAAAPPSPAVSADFANRSICLAYRGEPKPSSSGLIWAQSTYASYASPVLEDAVRAFLAQPDLTVTTFNDPAAYRAYYDATGRMVSTCSALIGR